jgi:hypothetical protein
MHQQFSFEILQNDFLCTTTAKQLQNNRFLEIQKQFKKQHCYDKGLNQCFSTLNCAYFAFESSANASFFSDRFSVRDLT